MRSIPQELQKPVTKSKLPEATGKQAKAKRSSKIRKIDSQNNSRGTRLLGIWKTQNSSTDCSNISLETKNFLKLVNRFVENPKLIN
jgi:hypothetical protein